MRDLQEAQNQESRDDARWIPILDYAVLRGVSTSTLRRHIKAKKIQYKIENGRYLLLADASLSVCAPQSISPQSIDSFKRVQELEEKLLQAEEQISELKMLVAIYEEKLAQPNH